MALSRAPQQITEGIWYYEERTGIEVVIVVRDDSGNLIKTARANIPWTNIRRSLKRKDSKSRSST